MTKTVLELLNEPLPEHHVSQREGASGKQLDYIESWFVIQQANDIFGKDKWSMETTRLEHIGTTLGKDKNGKDRYYVAYRATVKITVKITVDLNDEFIIREGSGFGNGMGTELDAHELALKEAESDALKRAFKSFGNQFGLHLYDKDRLKVDVLGDAGFKNFVTRNEYVELIQMLMDNWNPQVCDLESLKKYARRAAKTEPQLVSQFTEGFKKLEKLEKDFESEADYK